MKNLAFLALIVVAGATSGCVSAGALQRCYAIKLPFVMVGPCLATREALDPTDHKRQRPLYLGQ